MCSTEEEGRALAGLLERCSFWKLEVLKLEGDVGRETWEGMARAAGRGKVEQVNTRWEVVQRGRRRTSGRCGRGV